jgi:iron complex outermembrane receptor protein
VFALAIITKRTIDVRNRELTVSRIGSAGLAFSVAMPLLTWCLCANAATLSGTTIDNTRLGEIVVTAERRERDLQKTSVAVSAFDQRTLDDLSIRELTDFEHVVPGLVFSQDNSEFKVLIRGVGSDDTGTNSQPGVALHLDGVFVGRAAGFNAATYDIERIEVLRGPQGTLFGRNSTGGTINVHSKKPAHGELSVMGDIRYGDYDEVRIRGAVNIPLVEDKVAARLTLVSEERDGFENNLYPGGKDGSDADDDYWRAQLLYEPNDDFNLILRASGLNSRGVGPGRKRLQTPSDCPRAGCSEIAEDQDDLYTVWKDTAEHQSVDLDLFSAEANWGLSFANLTAIASTGETKFIWHADGDQTRAKGTEPGGVDMILGAPISSEQDLAEVRLTSLPSAPIEWLAGLFFFDEETNTDFGLTNIQPNPFVPDIIVTTKVISNWDIDTVSYAAFGQISYSLGAEDQFKLTAGARYTHDKADGEIYDLLTIDFLNASTLTEETLSERWSEITWRLGADWQVTPSNLLYTSLSTGYRTGGFNFQAETPEESIYDPEDLLAFEIGSKNRFFDDRLQLNLAAFYYDYKDFQTFQIVEDTLFIENAAEVSNRGVEAELQAIVTDAFSIDAHFAIQRGRFEEFLSGDPLYPRGYDLIPNSGDELADLSGKHLPNTPDKSGHIGASYKWRMGGLGSLTVRGQTYYQSEVYSRAFNLPIGKQGSYKKSSLQIRFDERDENWYVLAGVDNMEGENDIANIAITQTGRVLANIGAPRTWYIGFGFQM